MSVTLLPSSTNPEADPEEAEEAAVAGVAMVNTAAVQTRLNRLHGLATPLPRVPQLLLLAELLLLVRMILMPRMEATKPTAPCITPL
jgi:hypothetical protein